MRKTCSKCSTNKEISEFPKDKSGKFGVRSICKECTKLASKAWREKFPDKAANSSKRSYQKYRSQRIDAVKEYYRENSESIKAREREYYRRVKDLYAEYNKHYRKSNPDKFRLYSQNRRVRKLNLPDSLTEKDVADILETFENKCSLSGSKDIHLDHFIPIATGQVGNVKENIIPLSAELNLSKGSKNPFEWIKQRNDIDRRKFQDVVLYLAKLNDMTPEDYERYVYRCFEKPQNKNIS